MKWYLLGGARPVDSQAVKSTDSYRVNRERARVWRVSGIPIKYTDSGNLDRRGVVILFVGFSWERSIASIARRWGDGRTNWQTTHSCRMLDRLGP